MSRRVAATQTPTRGVPEANRGSILIVCLALAALILAVFGQTFRHEFVNLDDNENVYENPVVSKGLSVANTVWAFTHTQVSRWVPISTLAHMMDSELYGIRAGGHHLTCVLLHTATAIFLFLFLFEATAAFWRSAFVAAVFAIHPLHVEAVAWVSALQYALSGMFFMLTLWVYVRYARQPSTPRYFAVAGFFLLGLLSKEMLVTAPAVLMLLDYWPLRRWPGTASDGTSTVAPAPARSLRQLLLEKAPLFGLSVVSSAITIIALRSFRQPVLTYTWPVRIGNAFVSYAAYIGQMLFPQGLTPWYPHPGNELSGAEVILSAVVVLVISGVVFALRHTRPYLIIGWLWYVGVLVPVIGLIQRGEQARCDRYTYLSQIGLYIMIAWGAGDLCSRWRLRRLFVGAAAAAVLVILAVCAHVQASHWRNSEALWKHTLAHTTRNYVAHSNLAVALAESGRLPDALGHFEQAVRIRPTSPEAQNNYGYALTNLGRRTEAIPFYQNALRLKPDFVNAHLNLADALVALGRPGDAKQYYDAAARLTGTPSQMPK
jgi:protein O-mannosyl-transferase